MAECIKDYSKFTVPQLKARCKELKLSGYSKLGKAALLEKLAKEETSAQVTSNVSANTNRDTTAPPVRATHEPLLLDRVHNLSNKRLLASRFQNRSLVQNTAVNQGSLPPTSREVQKISQTSKDLGVPICLELIDRSAPNKCTSVSLKRSDPEVSESQGSDKKTKTSHVLDITYEDDLSSISITLNQRLKSPQTILQQETLSDTRCTSKSKISTEGRRFRPLISVKHLRAPPATTSTSCNSHTPIIIQDIQNKKTQLYYLEFQAKKPFPENITQISMPPSLSQRKDVYKWSVALSALSNEDRIQCCLVSRMFRYAVYLSAGTILRKLRPSQLSELSEKYRMDMMDFWPLLNQIQEEALNKKFMYYKTFLSRFYKDHMPLKNSLWYCPDHDKQATIAIRFLLTKLWFQVSIPSPEKGDISDLLVEDAQPVIDNEIWHITVRDCRKKSIRAYFILEPTCEVIGHPTTIATSTSFVENSGNLLQLESVRMDWSNYIEQYRLSEPLHGSPSSLFHHLKCSNTEEYQGGISKVWLSRIREEGELGAYKKVVAERYVIACVVGNSISGRWMSSSYMAQVFSGNVSSCEIESITQKRIPKVNLYLPEHHLIESLHFT